MKNQVICAACKKEANYPISLHCQHKLCIKCGENIRTIEQESLVQNKYQISCPKCKKITRTTDILNLLDDVCLDLENNGNISGTNQQNTAQHIIQQQTDHKQFQPQLQLQQQETQDNQQNKFSNERRNSLGVNKQRTKSETIIQGQDFKTLRSPSIQQPDENFIHLIPQFFKPNQQITLSQQQIQNSNNQGHLQTQQVVQDSSQLLASINNIQEEKPIICKEHNDFVSLYCQDDKQLLCVNCLYQSEKHKRHRVGPLKKSLDLIRNENKLFKFEAKDKLLLIENSIKICQQNKYLLDVGYKNVVDSATKEFGELISLIKNQEIKIKEELKRLFSDRLEEYDKTINDLQYLKNCMREYKEFDKIDNSNLTLYVFSIFSMIKKTLNSIDFNFKQMQIADLNILDFHNKSQIKRDVENFGKIISELSIRDVKKRSPSRNRSNSRTPSPYRPLQPENLNTNYLLNNGNNNSNNKDNINANNNLLTFQQYEEKAALINSSKRKISLTQQHQIQQQHIQNTFHNSQQQLQQIINCNVNTNQQANITNVSTQLQNNNSRTQQRSTTPPIKSEINEKKENSQPQYKTSTPKKYQQAKKSYYELLDERYNVRKSNSRIKLRESKENTSII